MGLHGQEGDSRHRGQGDGAVTLGEPAGHDLLPLVGMTLMGRIELRDEVLTELNGKQ